MKPKLCDFPQSSMQQLASIQKKHCCDIFDYDSASDKRAVVIDETSDFVTCLILMHKFELIALEEIWETTTNIASGRKYDTAVDSFTILQ